MKKLLCTMALVMTLCNVLFAQEVKVGNPCKNGQSVCPPSNDGTLYGRAEKTGAPTNSYYEYTCEYWTGNIDTSFNGWTKSKWKSKIQEAVKNPEKLKKAGLFYDASTKMIKCKTEERKNNAYPYDNKNNVIGCYSNPQFDIDGVRFSGDCKVKKVINLKNVISGTKENVLRQTNLSYNGEIQGYVNLSKQNDVMNGKNYVNGDYAVTANSVLKYYGDNNYDRAKTSYKKEASFGENSSKQKISLPPQLKPEDIVFARLYWAGNIHSGQHADTTLKNVVSVGSLNDKAKSKIKSQIKGYREVMIQVEKEQPKKFVAEDEDVYFDYSVDYIEGGLYFMYSNSVDVKKYIQDAVKNNSSKFDSTSSAVDIEVAVGNIKSMEGDVRQFYNSMVGTHVLTGKYDFWNGSYGIYIANYGNWSLFVVYDKNASVDSKIKKKFYKPKYVTLYHGMSELMAPTNLKSVMTFNMDGFYTPTSDDYDARVSFFTNQNVGYDNEGKGGFMAFQKDKYKQNGYETTPVKPGGEKWLYPGIFITEAGSPNGIEKGYKKHNTGAIGMYTRNVDKFMFGSQTQTSAQFGVSNWDGAGEQSLLTYMAFSTDVYVPRICYAYHVYSSNGEKDNFSAVRGDKIRTIIKFKNEAANGEKSEKATGVIANFVMDSNNSYIKDSLILNNNVSSNKTFKEHKEKVDKILENGTNNTEFAFLKDNEKGAYKNKARTDKFDNGIYHDRMLNNVASEKIKKTEYQRVVEYDKDDKDKSKPKITIKPIEVTYDTTKVKLAIGKDIKGDKEFVGGDLDVGEQVFTEYESILGDRYVQNKFTLDFAQVINGQKIQYTNQEIDECKPDPDDTHGEKIKVIPLNGLRVVNQNVTQNDVDNALDKITGKLKDSFNSHLYTQIGGKEFKANLVYTPDISRSVTMNKDGTVTVWGEDGKSSKTMSYEEFIAQATKDTKFNSYGVVYLSLIPKETLLDKKNKKECKDLTIGMYKSSGTPITGSDTVPFYYGSHPKSVKIGTGTPNEMSQDVNKNYSEKHPHPSYAVDFNGKNFLPLDQLKVDYDMNNYTFVVSYAPYKVNQKEFEDGKEDSKTSDAVKDCQKAYDEGYTKCSSESANFCSAENNQKDNGGSYSLCLVKKNQSCLAKVSKTYQNCIGGSKEVIKDAVVNKQGLFNVCASDNFAVRPKLIRYVGENLPRYKAGIKMSENFQRFKAENEDGKPAYGYNVVLNDTYSGDGSLDGAKILEQNTGKDDYKPYDPKSQFSISAIAPVLPRNCNVNNVTGISSDGKMNSNLWKNSGMRLGADFRLRNNGSNVIDQANISKLEDDELNKYRNSVRPGGGRYELDSKYDKYGYVYTTPNADNDLDKGKNQKTMSLEYYNIGWAGFTLVDNKWTTHDQAGDCVEDDKGRFSNKPTTDGKDAGRVGCSIGLVVDKPIKDVAKDEQKWVYAAFDYDRVDVDLLDLKDAFNQTDKSQGKLQNNASRSVNFTYFYNGDTNVTARSGYIANSNLNPTDNGMGATMLLKSTARLATQASVDGKIENALYFGVNSTNNGVETKTVNGTAVKRGIIPTLFNENCYAQTVTFDMDNGYMPKSGANPINDHAGLNREKNPILESSRNWTFENFAINTMFVQGQTKQTSFNTALTKPFQMLNTGFANGVNNGNFYINFLKSNLVRSSTGGGTGARNPLIIVAEDFHASADLDVCANPKACVIPAKNTTPTYDPSDIFNSFANGSDRRIQAVATTGNPSYYYNAIDRKTTPLNATNLATNPVGVARFYYGNFNNAQVRPVGTQQLNVASNYFIQPMIYCDDKANGNACFNNLFPLFGLATGENEADLVIDAGQRPNFYLNRAFTYGNAGGLDITNNLRTSYGGGTSSVSVKPNNMLSATGNQKNYSEQISVIISGGAGTTQEVRIFVKPWFLSDYSSANLNYNRFFVNAAGGAAWAGAGGVKEDKAKKRELRNVGSFLNDTDVTTDGNSKNRTNRITW